MRTAFVATVAAFIAVACTASASAAPTEVTVRVEGQTETLFEGPVLTDGHDVKGASDSIARRCDGLNNGANPTPGPTPTAATVDAMRIIGEPFDGNWFTQYDDYFITQWGPDRQDDLTFAYWGIVVNNVFSNVGGCQLQVDAGDEVFWIYDAFNGRERLALYPADYLGGPVPATATAQLNQPFEVEVDTWAGYNEGEPPASPERSTTPYEGAEVAPVLTGAKGFQKVDVDDPATVSTGNDGRASITFTTPGWHRIKATDFAAGVETVIRSNRLDVCVPQPPATGCGALPADAQLRTPPREEGEGPPKVDPPSGGETGTGGDGSGTQPPPAVANRVRVALEGLDRSRLRSAGLVGVSWRVLDPGAGVRRWTIAAKRLGQKGARFVNRKSGREQSSAKIKLPRGATFRLRITFTDALGRATSANLGKVRVPKQS